MVAMIALLKEKKAKIILTQTEFSNKSAKIIAREVGATVVPFSPLNENIFDQLEKLSNTIRSQMK